MKRSHIPVLLMLLFGATLVLPLWPVVNYAWNKDYIASVLCINRDKPEMKCEGKCHLNKMMVTTHEQSQNQSEGMPTELLVAFSTFPCVFLPLSFRSMDFSFRLDHLIRNEEMPLDVFDGRIFHPPRC